MATLVLVLGLAACGGDATSTSVAETSTTEETTSTAVADSENVNTDFGTLTPDVSVDERDGTEPGTREAADLEAAADAAGCDLELDLPDEGNTHFDDPDEMPAYKTNPPTSGDHFADFDEAGAGAFADGAFLDTPPANRVVHSLEHGRVAIQYSPELPEEDQLALKGVFDEDRPGVLLFPNADMPYDVAVTAWTRMLGCKEYEGAATLDAVRLFRDEFRGKGPEAVAF
jgi:Protein of unknown function (DUF3105)